MQIIVNNRVENIFGFFASLATKKPLSFPYKNWICVVETGNFHSKKNFLHGLWSWSLRNKFIACQSV